MSTPNYRNVARSVLVFVLRDVATGDCTNGGVSSRETMLTLYASYADFAADPNANPEKSLIVDKLWPDTDREYVRCEPVIKPQNAAGPMAGGNYVHTSDSRYREVTGVPYPIAVHDRFESWADYARLSV